MQQQGHHRHGRCRFCNASMRHRADVGCDLALQVDLLRRIEQERLRLPCAKPSIGSTHAFRAFVLHADDNQATIA
ncbi:hypothetical protein XEU83M_06820 [Xanthomonas euvesicatoria]|uniref:Uncharacterized protein n=2 Tax=Xanthomonas euvesicatoria TaxID=456327 RepID=Q3BN95_XANE5|nr:hypothetical protein XEU66b_14305 [Xanthomonas euvesicatoria]CAJ25768.1 hypothetical protein XCV4037 [Xanthomonas euvesicatoria pv. vesicatoria str. 85-10]KHL66443.1 hypothetical protein XEU83M_06820 [Xanthomonas euvesicatoria]OCG81384.1 hypothetical protein XEULMG905_20550 [Xanthomonas euvesicatoria]OCG85015.1 hypothetical protein LMG667_14170 [Xanthomonas euvesicatoria]